jgi:hypothetical protein
MPIDTKAGFVYMYILPIGEFEKPMNGVTRKILL